MTTSKRRRRRLTVLAATVQAGDELAATRERVRGYKAPSVTPAEPGYRAISGRILTTTRKGDPAIVYARPDDPIEVLR